MDRFTIVVSGLPRSGTSMMMRMLHAGGLPLVSDGQRAADEDNPRGYFEDRRVKKLKEDNAWLRDPDLAGKVIKVVSLLLYNLPPGVLFRVLFMERRMEEVLASQKKMLQNQGMGTDGIPDELMAQKFNSHLLGVRSWIREQPNLKCLYLPYHEVVADPSAFAARIADFLQLPLDLPAMAAAVDGALYRNRV